MIVAVPVVILLVWCLIYPVTDYYVRLLAPEVIKKGVSPEKKICLTFDDGPDAEYTPALLKILQKAEIPAVFFLVGRKCEAAPNLVQEIRDAGHEIGLHTYYHQHSYLMFVYKSLITMYRDKTAVEKAAGRPVTFFRPPWGALNLFQYLTAKWLQLKIVLWTANARDWNLETQPDGIYHNLLQKVGPGSIIVLHDSGGDPGAPRNTLQALPRIIEHYKANGYQFVALQEICGNMKAG